MNRKCLLLLCSALLGVKAHAGCVRTGGYLLLKMGYAAGFLNNKPTLEGSPPAPYFVTVPLKPVGVGHIFPLTLRQRSQENGFSGGIGMGYDFELVSKPSGAFVFGLELSGSLSTLSGTVPFQATYMIPGSDPQPYQERVRVQSRGYFDVTTRWGVAFCQLMPYIKLGFTMIRNTFGLKRSGISYIQSRSRSRWTSGFIGGVGLERQMTDIFFMGAEVTYSIFATKAMVVPFAHLGSALVSNSKSSVLQALLFFKYKFPVKKTWQPAPYGSYNLR